MKLQENMIFIFSLILIIIFIEVYAFQAVKTIVKKNVENKYRWLIYCYSTSSIMALICLFYSVFVSMNENNRVLLEFLRFYVLLNLLAKLVLSIFVLIDDMQRGIRWIIKKTKHKIEHKIYTSEEKISRSTFLAKTGIIVAAAPVLTLSWGIISGAHDYRLRKIKIPLKNLPSSLHGIKIAQISDIHAGSFWNKTAVKGGVEMLTKEKADLIFFTGDLVNNKSNEMNNWLDVFGKIEAPLGVYSVLGNHDYGDYVSWSSAAAKRENLKELFTIEKNMGWTLLNNTHRVLDIEGAKLGIIGVENWSAIGRFPKYGDMAAATANMPKTDVNILLSHDPSHWDAEIRPKYPQMDLTLAGHTHGMQFGVEIPGFKWSPIEYLYKEWAGLYQSKNQYLYVNRGFGYIGYPGRVGILPELTIIELEKA